MKDINKLRDIALSFIFSVPKNHIPLPIETKRIDLKSAEDIEKFTRYVVLDFETTGFSHEDSEIIEVGLARYESGKEVATYSTFVNPMRSLPKSVTKLTGITDDDLRDAPTINEVVPHIRKFIYGCPIVAFNAPFDLSFLKDAYERYGVGAVFQYVDVLVLARKAFPDLGNHKLSTLIDVFHLSDGQTHRALDDVRCTQKLLELCFDKLKSETLEPSTKKKSKTVKPSDIHPTVEYIDPNTPLYGKNVVFTGVLSIARSDAIQLAINVGAVVKTAVSDETHFLVVGYQDSSLIGTDRLSSKQRKAIELNNSGKARISIISERDFMDLLNPSLRVDSSNRQVDGSSFALIGDMKHYSQEALCLLIEQHGGTITKSFQELTNSTSFVVIGDNANNERLAVQDLGITTITEEELLSMLGLEV